MKRASLITLCAFLLIFYDIDAQFSIGDPISITDGDDTYGYRSPRIAKDVNGDLLVFWMRTGSNEAFYLSRKDASGFSAPIEIPLNGLNPNLWSGSLGPNMAVGNGHVYVTFEVYGEAIYISHSSDGGSNWNMPIAAYAPTADRKATIPNVAVDQEGQPYVIYVNTDSNEEDAHYGIVKSADHGATFSDEVIVNDQTGGNEVCECCNGHVQVAENGDVFVAFRNNNNFLRDNWLVRSTDGGNTFTSFYDMDQTDWTANVCPSSGPHFYASNDKVITTFFTAASGWENGCYFSSLDLNTEEISNTTQLPFADVSAFLQNRPKIAGTGDTLAIVYQENFNGSTDIAMSFSSTGAEGLNNGSVYLSNAENTQQYPHIAFANDAFHVVYEDLLSNTVVYQEIGIMTNVINEIGGSTINIFPNPVEDTFVIEGLDLLKTDKIVISNVLGKSVLIMEPTKYDIDISSLESGSYVLSVFQDNKISSKVLIKK